MSHSTSETGTTEDEYQVRRYDRDDVDGVLELDRLIWNRDHDADWFRWKYERNPYVDEAPVFVAERDGDVVGARPLMAFQLRSGEETRFALQPADTMVHPDHRRRGLFTRMTELAIDSYESERSGFFFNFPNSQSRPGYEKLGWQLVEPRVTYYRVERPSTFLDGSMAKQLLGHAAGPTVRGYVRARRAASSTTSDASIEVERVDGGPAERLASLYRTRVPDRIHANRTAEFLEWRFASPVWDRKTYVAVADDGDVAGLMTRTRTVGDGTVVTQIADVLPLVGGEQWRTAIGVLLDATLDDHDGTDLFSIVPGAVPRKLLTSFGFLPDDAFPLSRLTNYNKTLATRPFDPDADDAWSLNARALDSPDSWLVSYVEQDTS